MKPQDQERIRYLLKQSLRPTGTHPRATLVRDLWPAMLRRVEQRSVAVPWFDWALLGVLIACLALFPRAIPILLYHL
jgi:hypothetical protein